MSAPNLNEASKMFSEMVIDTTKKSEIESQVNLILKGKDRYEKIAQKVNPKIPWYAIGVAHCMEAGCDFTKHIHCGDSLKARTINEPKGRPEKGNPPFTWEESCEDWLIMKGWHKWQDWGIADILCRLELNNGTGYRKYNIPTPYLWSYTNFYQKGKFVSDGKFDPNAVSKQVGAAILLKKLNS